MEKSDEQLVHETSQGDLGSFTALIERHKDKVHGLAFRMLRDEHEAEEVAQDVFLRIYRSAKRYRGEARFSTYLYRVAINVCFTRLKRRRTAVPTVDGLESVRNRTSVANPLHDLERDEMRLAVRRAVANLPRNSAAAVALFHFEELSYEEIAETLRVPVGTVKTWLHRGRALLRKMILESTLTEELRVDEV